MSRPPHLPARKSLPDLLVRLDRAESFDPCEWRADEPGLAGSKRTALALVAKPAAANQQAEQTPVQAGQRGRPLLAGFIGAAVAVGGALIVIDLGRPAKTEAAISTELLEFASYALAEFRTNRFRDAPAELKAGDEARGSGPYATAAEEALGSTDPSSRDFAALDDAQQVPRAVLVAPPHVAVAAGQTVKLGARVERGEHLPPGATIVVHDVPQMSAIAGGTPLGDGSWQVPVHSVGEAAIVSYATPSGVRRLRLELVSARNTVISHTDVLLSPSQPMGPKLSAGEGEPRRQSEEASVAVRQVAPVAAPVRPEKAFKPPAATKLPLPRIAAQPRPAKSAAKEQPAPQKRAEVRRLVKPARTITVSAPVPPGAYVVRTYPAGVYPPGTYIVTSPPYTMAPPPTAWSPRWTRSSLGAVGY